MDKTEHTRQILIEQMDFICDWLLESKEYWEYIKGYKSFDELSQEKRKELLEEEEETLYQCIQALKSWLVSHNKKSYRTIEDYKSELMELLVEEIFFRRSHIPWEDL